jgi:membrane protease YdiL (CAAX protease family)
MDGTAPDRSDPPAGEDPTPGIGAAPPQEPGPPPAPPSPPRASAGGFFAAVLLLYLLPGALAQGKHLGAGLAWTQLFAFLLPAAAAAAGANLRPGAFLLLARRPSFAQVGLGLLAGVAGFAAAGSLVALWSHLLPPAWLEAYDIGRLFEGTPVRRAAMVELTALLAPVCEEIAFRGYLQSALRLRLPDRATLGLGAALFAAMHLNPVSLPGLLLLGLLFGWLALRAGSIWPAVAAHLANNGISSVLAATGLADGAPAAPTVGAILGPLAFSVGGLAAVLGAYRAATPAPPPPLDAAVPFAPALAADGFRWSRLPPGYLLWAALGSGALALLLNWR